MDWDGDAIRISGPVIGVAEATPPQTDLVALSDVRRVERVFVDVDAAFNLGGF